jgi:hypothetical protein
MRIFSELGGAIEEAWRATSYDERALPTVATSALRKAALHARVSSEDVLRWAIGARELPAQDDLAARFGDPPLTVFSGRRFYIQVLFWLEGSTSIHRHSFSGAFMVLDGTSLHGAYAFKPRRRINTHFYTGEIELLDAEILDRGAVVPITNDLSHSLFHLEVPCATVVVRTYADDDASPQFNYFPPSVAIDPFFRDAPTTRMIQLLSFARRGKHLNFEGLAGEILARADLHTTWDVLDQVYRALGSVESAAPLVAIARQRHGEVIDDLAAALAEELRRRAVERLRNEIDRPDLRFFLALLANLPHREAIDAMIQQRYPNSRPRDRIEGWLRKLSGAETIGIDFTDAVTAHAFFGLLDGGSSEAALEALKKIYDPEDVEARRAALLRHCERMKTTALAPLLCRADPGRSQANGNGGFRERDRSARAR